MMYRIYAMVGGVTRALERPPLAIPFQRACAGPVHAGPEPDDGGLASAVIAQKDVIRFIFTRFNELGGARRVLLSMTADVVDRPVPQGPVPHRKAGAPLSDGPDKRGNYRYGIGYHDPVGPDDRGLTRDGQPLVDALRRGSPKVLSVLPRDGSNSCPNQQKPFCAIARRKPARGGIDLTPPAV
jgi:hypothetical protein